MIGACIALGAQMLVEVQAGEALNDITGVAFSAGRRGVARERVLRTDFSERGRSWWRAQSPQRKPRRLSPGPIASRTRQIPAKTPTLPPLAAKRTACLAPISIAGLAMGLAAGVKLSFLTPAAVLTVGVIVIAGRGQRLRTAVAWIVPMVATGGFWYVRNLVAVGNPIPYIHHLGPISLPDRSATSRCVPVTRCRITSPTRTCGATRLPRPPRLARPVLAVTVIGSRSSRSTPSLRRRADPAAASARRRHHRDRIPFTPLTAAGVRASRSRSSGTSATSLPRSPSRSRSCRAFRRRGRPPNGAAACSPGWSCSSGDHRLLVDGSTVT